MVDTIIKVTGPLVIPAGVVTSDDAAVDMPEDGHILAIQAGIHITVAEATLPIAGAEVNALLSAELSFLSTHQFNSNDARGSLMEIHVGYHMSAGTAATDGFGSKINECQILSLPKGIPVNAGERIHAHCSSSPTGGTCTGRYFFLIFLELRGGSRRASKRR